MTRIERIEALMKRLEQRAMALPCVDGVPVDPTKRAHISRRYRPLLTALGAEARAAFARDYSA